MFDNRLSETSPKLAMAGQSITYQYDLLNRPLSRTEPDGTTTWAYDDVTNGNLGLGQVHSESLNGFSKVYSYSPFDYGRLTSTTTTIGTETYTTARSYDAQGRISTEQYPDNTTTPGGFVVQYTYSPVGHLEAVEALDNGAVLYQLLETDASGRVVEEWLGDGSTVAQSFQGVSKRIASQHSMVGAATIQHFDYTYDNVGNMTGREDVFHGVSETFTYDTLDRLTSAQSGGGAPTYYGFNSIGNMVEKSDVGTSYLYNLSKLHAVSDITPGSGLPAHTFAYDANGNLDTLDGTPMITWSSYNKPVSITTTSTSYGFDYGPDRARFRKVHNGLTTHYVGYGFEAINSMGLGFDVHRHYIRANGRVVMIREDVNGTVKHRYVHTDHLGSITALTEQGSGAVLERYSYDAWGMRRNPTTWEPAAITSLEKRGYTGHEHLDDVGMIHMNGRVYSPSLGRMLSPDPVTQAPENAQNYNRYSYAYNNPLKYTDPSGFSSDDKKTVCADGCYQSGTAMEEVVVTGVRGGVNTPSILDNPAGLSNWMSMSANNQLRAATEHSMRDQKRALALGQDIQNGAIVATTEDGDLVDSDGNAISESDYFAQENDRANIVDGVSVANTVSGFALGIGEKVVVNSDGTWLGKNLKYYRPGWGGNGRSGGRSVALRYARGFRIGGIVSLGATTMLTTYNVRNNYQSSRKGFVDIGMSVVGLAWPLGTFVSISYFTVDYANDGNWTGE